MKKKIKKETIHLILYFLALGIARNKYLDLK
jgi:hypothetical protein